MSNMLHGKWRLGLLLSGLLMVFIVAGVFLFNSVSTPKVNASTTLFPATASPGSTILVTGSGYPSQEHLNVYFQTPDRGVIAPVTNAQGSFSALLAVPSTYMQGIKYYVHVDSASYSTQLLFNFARLSISLANPNTQPIFGSQTSFSGTGFKPNEEINLAWSNGISTLNAGTTQTGSDGSFNITLTMPSFPHLAQFKLVATGNSSGFSTSTAITEAPGILYDPTTAPAGTTVHLTGGAFGSNEPVNVSFMGSPVATAVTNKNGAFTTSFNVSASDQIGYQDNAIIATGTLSQQWAKGGFDRQPTIKIQPNQGGAGTRVEISGKHFTHNGEVRIYLISDREHESRVDRCLLADIHASNNGTFSIVVTIPNGDCLEDNSHIVAVDVKTGDSAVSQFNGQDNDERHED